MNLTELQIELRSIEDHISQLHSEIENMKPQTDEQKKTDFDAITKLAKQHPTINLSIVNAPELLQKEFINSLSYLLLTEEKDVYGRLLYLCRLAIGCKLKMSAEDIYKSGLEFESKDIEKICAELQEYKYSYLIEAFIIANLSEEAPVNILTVIADIAKLMGCDKEEIRVLAQIAKSKLIGNLEIVKDIPLPSKNRWSGKIVDYIPKEWIVLQRKECATICIDKFTRKNTGSSYRSIFATMNAVNSTSETVKNYDEKHPCVVKSRSQAGSIVKKGETILVYEEVVKKKSKTNSSSSSPLVNAMLSASLEGEIVKETRTITAPNDGIVFFVEAKKKGEVSVQEDKYLAAYVVSFFDDYNDFCKWYASKK